MGKPVVLYAVFVNRPLYAFRQSEVIAGINDLFCPFDYPRKNAFSGIVVKIVSEIFNVVFAFDFGIERNDDQPAPDIPTSEYQSTELRDILRRKSLKFAYVTSSLSDVFCESVINQYEDAKLFACTKELLSSSTHEIQSYSICHLLI